MTFDGYFYYEFLLYFEIDSYNVTVVYHFLIYT